MGMQSRNKMPATIRMIVVVSIAQDCSKSRRITYKYRQGKSRIGGSGLAECMRNPELSRWGRSNVRVADQPCGMQKVLFFRQSRELKEDGLTDWYNPHHHGVSPRRKTGFLRDSRPAWSGRNGRGLSCA